MNDENKTAAFEYQNQETKTENNSDETKDSDNQEQLNTGNGEGEAGETKTENAEDDLPVRARKRIDKLTARNKELQQRLQNQQQMQQQQVVQQDVIQDPMTGQVINKPDMSNYDDWKKYQVDLEQFNQKKMQAESMRNAYFRQQEEVQKKMSALEAQADALSDKYEDFDLMYFRARDPNFPIKPGMAEAILDSDKGAEILYHLGKNPAEALRISNLSAIGQAKEIGKIEESLVVPKKISSNAPSPLEQRSTSGVSSTKSRDNMTMEERRQYWATRK